VQAPRWNLGMASPDDHRSRVAGAAGRAALFPARAAAHMWRDQLEDVLDAVLSSPEAARAVDRALAGPLPEQVAESVVRHRVLERMVAELAASGEIDRLLNDGLGSARTGELADRLLASEQVRRVLGEVVSAPEVRHALTQQTAGLWDEVFAGLRGRAAHVDDRADRRHAPARATPYAGIATRALAFAVDVALSAAIYMSVVGVATLVSLLVGGLRPEWLVGILITIGWTLAGFWYFVLFWASAGRTPGMHLLRLRVRTASGEGPLSVSRSCVRVVGLILSIVPLFAGFIPVLFDTRRRGLADMLAGTVVVYDEPDNAGQRAPVSSQ
jgi:uncharacterized RDD family membrane protein YckC